MCLAKRALTEEAPDVVAPWQLSESAPLDLSVRTRHLARVDSRLQLVPSGAYAHNL